MEFNTELTQFPSLLHRNIHFAAIQLTPLERSLSAMQELALRNSCAEFHAFVLEMLSDMYENPEQYGLPAFALERFSNGQSLIKQNASSRAKRKAFYHKPITQPIAI